MARGTPTRPATPPARFRPPGEPCPEAPILTDDDLPYATIFDNAAATADGPPGSCNTPSALVMQNDVWLRYTASADCLLELLVNPDHIDGYDGIVAIYGGPDCGSLVAIACLDEPEPMTFSVPAATGETYWVQVGDWGTVEGGGQTILELTCVP